MKRKLILLLSAEALLCILVCILGHSLGDSLSSLLAFPYRQVSTLLRFISLSGSVGNAAALFLYGLICLVPLIYLAIRAVKHRARAEDGLLLLLSPLLFAVIYLMINPTDAARHFGAFNILSATDAFMGVLVDSVIVGYIILRLLRHILNSGISYIFAYLNVLLTALSILLTYGIFGSGLSALIASYGQLNAGNTDPAVNLSISYLFLILQFIVEMLPLLLAIVLIFYGFSFIRTLRQDPYDTCIAILAGKISRLCRCSVITVMISQIGVNVLQFILSSQIHSNHYTLSIPLLSVILMLTAMVLASYFEKARQLKEDNDMFI